MAKIKLNTIFWKIFLSYWLTMISIIALTTVAVGIYFGWDNLAQQRNLLYQYHSSTAVDVFEAGGPTALKKWLQEEKGLSPFTTYFFDESLSDQLGKPVPVELIKQIRAGDEPMMPARGGVPWVVISLESESQRPYWIAFPAFHPDRIRRSSVFQEYFRPPPIVWYPLSFLISGMVSFWLARNLTSPIRVLRTAAKKISSGDLSARVEQALHKRRDEFGDLSRDFDSMADQIEQLLSSQRRMLRDVSHELRSPLARLQVALALARRSAGTQAAAEHDRIEKETNRIDELIGQVLSLVRLTTRTDKVEMENYDLTELVRKVSSDANFEAQTQNKSVVLNENGSLQLLMNQELIHSALENIIRNALRYTPEQAVVEVSLSKLPRQVLISIRDHGPGVAEEVLPHLFEPFFREGEARDRASGGYGLGLAIAERAVKLHGGSIKASNAPGGGLLIEIGLPLV